MTVNTIMTKIKNRYRLNIAVLIEVPEKSKGLIFISHGFTSAKHRPTTQALAESALENHLIAVRFDMTHSTGESDGSVENANFTSFIHDLSDVIAWAKTQAWYCEPFILSGSSMGGFASLEYAHHYPTEIKAIAPICTAISGELSLAAYQEFQPERLKKWQENGYVELETPKGIVHLPWSHMEDRMQYDALSYAPQMNVPLFLIVGTKDTHCPPDQQQMLYDAWGSKDKELHIVQDVPHQWHTVEHLGILKSHFNTWLKKII